MAFFMVGLYGRLDCDVGDIGGAMDIVQRLILIALMLLSMAVHAAGQPPAVRYFGNWTSPEPRFDPSSAQAVCQAHLTWFKANTENVNSVIVACEGRSNDTVQTNIQRYNAANQDLGQSGFFQIAIKKHFCWESPNSVFGLSVPLVCSESEPPPPKKCEPGCNGVCGTEQPLTNRGTLACFNGCYYSLGDAWGLVVSNDNAGKPVKTWWTDVENNTGVPCDAPEDEQPDGAEDAPEKQDLPDPCPECDCAKKGMTWGSYTTNGTTTVMCLKPGTPGGKPVDIAPKPTVKTETPAPTPENPNPEPTTTTTPSPVITITPGSGAGSQPTVTETKTNPDGSTTSTSEPQSNYCEKNPNAKVCKDAEKEEGKGTWGGGCGSWECEGDAANCAMSRKIHQDRCDDIEGMEQFADAAGRGQRILHGEEDEDVTAYLNREGDGNRTVNVGSLVSDSGPYSFGASCISDVQFSIGGHAVSVPFSKICPYLEMIGYFLLAASYLAALRIVGFI